MYIDNKGLHMIKYKWEDFPDFKTQGGTKHEKTQFQTRDTNRSQAPLFYHGFDPRPDGVQRPHAAPRRIPHGHRATDGVAHGAADGTADGTAY